MLGSSSHRNSRELDFQCCPLGWIFCIHENQDPKMAPKPTQNSSCPWESLVMEKKGEIETALNLPLKHFIFIRTFSNRLNCLILN